MEELDKKTETIGEVQDSSTDKNQLVPVDKEDSSNQVTEKEELNDPILVADNEEDDIFLKTGEYYHDSENYPINIRFKHPFMNIISLLCGFVSCLCCVCAAPTPIFKFFIIFLVPSFLLSIIGTGIFIFDLIKSKTVNGLSISGLIVSLLGGIISIINLGVIITAFIIFDIFPAVAGFVTSIGGGIIAILTAIVGAVIAIFI